MDELNLPWLLEPVQSEMECVTRLLHERLAQAEEPLATELRRLIGGGKCIRPAMVILVGQLLAAPAQPFRELAAAVEMLHTATLIHDDLVDQTPLRRGKWALHTSWSARATVLAGDYLLAQSAALIADLEHPRILKAFAQAICAVCAGEIQQILPGENRKISREGYYHRIEAKTASLCATATEMAAVLAGAEERQVVALRRFGQELGIAFQIADDVLDLVGEEAQLGKPPGSDLRQGLATLPTILYLEATEEDTAVQGVLSGKRSASQVKAAIAAIRDSNATEAALAEARAHTRQGQAALLALPDHPARQMLYALAEYAVQRNR